MEIDVRHNAAASRYELTVDGALIGIAEYLDLGDTIEFHHTETAPPWRGQGLAARLVAFALADVRESDKRVVTTCWYVAEYVRDHPDAVSAASRSSSSDG
jgi:uncharacterized protein